ncbi:uncharacterized protein LOC115966516 [Quercus lobata]|uniref:uncharacterized protein LOC115966516 n=1 Tax=Quercus lobata TaxID=97700 RepID=UPI001247A077|nr:uncharacterized protein LOC115966516 [Quercus lobata]
MPKSVLDGCEVHVVDCIEGYLANGSEAVLEAVNTAGFHKTQGENSAPTIQDVQALQGIEEKGFRSAAPQRGALKPSFQKHVGELVRNHNPVMLVVMETRVGGNRAKEIIDRLPFDGSVYTDTIGYSGGLWLLWDSDRVDVTPLANTKQEIHATIKVQNSNSSWLFTVVYASPRSAEKFILWNNLIKTAELRDMPWVLASDFNEPLSDEDKFGGRALRTSLGKKRPFRLQTCWLSEPSFPSIVNHAWRDSPTLGDAVNRFTQVAIRWNGSHFGNIFTRKKNLLARINGIQRALSVKPSVFLVNLENELLKELDRVLNQEEELWDLKSRVNWMIQGD